MERQLDREGDPHSRVTRSIHVVLTVHCGGGENECGQMGGICIYIIGVILLYRYMVLKTVGGPFVI